MFNLSRMFRKLPGSRNLALPLKPRVPRAVRPLPDWTGFKSAAPSGAFGGGAGGPAPKFGRRWIFLQDDAAAPGFLSTIGAALGGIVSQVAPIYSASLAAKAAAQAQASTLKAQANLYTPQNINTLYQQQQFEAAQRGIQAGRDSGSVSTSVPWVPILIGAGVLGGLYFMTRK